MKRRSFIQCASLATGSLFLPPLLGYPSEKNGFEIGLQLYTLKDIINSDVKGTLKSVANIGFKKLEAFDYADRKIFDMSYLEFVKIANDLGMRVVSGHYGTGQIHGDQLSPEMGTLSNGWEQAVEDAAKAKQEYMVIAWLDPKERTSLDDYKKVCELMNIKNETCKKAGVKLSYHNHDFEFAQTEGQVPYDLMLKELDPTISMELDLYWITFAGFKPLDYFNKYPGRFDQWHVKDMDKKVPNRQTDVGAGKIDFRSIFKSAELAGLKHFYLEQEYFHQINSIAKGFKYLKTL